MAEFKVGTATTSAGAATKAQLDAAIATAGTVTAVSGVGAISVANGTTTPAVSIAASSGSVPGTMSAADFTKLAAIGAGASVQSVAGSSPISVATGTTTAVVTFAITSQAQGDTVYFDGSNWVRLGAGTNGQFLKTQGAGANPVWASGNSGTVTSVSGSSPISVATGTTTPAITFAIASQAQGDVVYFDGSNWVRLGAGTNGQYLKTQGASANPIWATVSAGVSSVTASSPLASSGGATPDISYSIASQAQGDISYFNGTNWVRLGAGTSGQLLKTGGASANPAWADAIDTQSYGVAGGTWTKPANAKYVKIIVYGAGGGGGSGGRLSAGTTKQGGGGGGGGARVERYFLASDLPSTLTIACGTGGAGVAGVGSDSIGNVGNAGGNTSATNGGVTYAIAYGGGGGCAGRITSVDAVGGGGGGWGGAGAVGTTSASLGGLPAQTAGAFGLSGQGAGGVAGTNPGSPAEHGGGGGGVSQATATATSQTGGTSLFGAGGGGSGGGNSGATARAGAAGGNVGVWVAAGGGGGAGGTIGNNDAVAGTNGNSDHGGTGGGGGASGQAAVGQPGKNGGNHGGGGGAGGASTTTSGASGSGGDGQCYVISW